MHVKLKNLFGKRILQCQGFGAPDSLLPGIGGHAAIMRLPVASSNCRGERIRSQIRGSGIDCNSPQVYSLSKFTALLGWVSVVALPYWVWGFSQVFRSSVYGLRLRSECSEEAQWNFPAEPFLEVRWLVEQASLSWDST